MAKLHVGWLCGSDIPEIASIDAACFDFPLTEDRLRSMYRETSVVGRIAHVRDTVAGFLMYQMHPNCLGIRRMAVCPAFWRQGIGTRLLEEVTGKLSTECSSAAIVIRESQLGAQLFLRARGFRATEVARGYYRDSGEDAYWFERRHESVREPILLNHLPENWEC